MLDMDRVIYHRTYHRKVVDARVGLSKKSCKTGVGFFVSRYIYFLIFLSRYVVVLILIEHKLPLI